jgi:hypothetical protein
MITQIKTGYILIYQGTSILSKSIEFFMTIFNIKRNKPLNWIPSHMGTLYVEDNKVYIGESVWLRYKINDFNKEYSKGSYIIMKPKEDFIDQEQEIGKQYILELSASGSYQWWKYPAWIFYSLTGKKWLFSKKSSDYNTICYESTARVLEKMRPEFFPNNYDFEAAYYGDILFDNRLEILIDNRK